MLSFKTFLALLCAISSCSVVFAQNTVCPAPLPGAPNCFQTSRFNNGNPLANHPPIPNQDCCNAIRLCSPLNEIDNGVIVPPNAPPGIPFPGCVADELPNPANTCFSNNEKGTTWYKFQIQPLPGGPTAQGSPAGKLRFKIIPLDAIADPDYDPFNDNGVNEFGATDFDFLLFRIPTNPLTDGNICTAIKQSTAFGNPTSLIKSCNWSGVKGPTGLFEPGTGSEMAQGPATRFNKPLPVKVGEVYYLAIDNFSINLQGFDVDFRGLEAPDDSSAIVHLPGHPIHLKSIEQVACSTNQFRLTLTQPVLCSSVNPSKFKVTGSIPGLQIQSIISLNNCPIFNTDTAFLVTLNSNTPDTTLKIKTIGIIENGCGSQVETDSLRFRMGPNAANPITILQQGSILFAIAQNADQFQWFFNGSPISGAQQDSLLITQDGNYSVRALVNGCLDSTVVQFFTDMRPALASQNWTIFPNPAVSLLHLSGTGIREIRIWNVLGKEVLQNSHLLQTQNSTVSVEGLENGMYWVELSGNDQRRILKLQIQR